MDLPYLLQQLGGCARRKELLRHGSPRDLARAVESGEIVRCGRGRYAVPGLDEAAREAHRLSGVISGRSAALFWNLSLRLAPGKWCDRPSRCRATVASHATAARAWT